MTSNIETTLQDAFDFIEADQLEQARSLLRTVLETEKNNPDVWWVYAHAVNDPESARLALLNVLALDSNYSGAQALLTALEQKNASGQELTEEELASEPPFVPVLPDSLPDLSESRRFANSGDKVAINEVDSFDEIDTGLESKSIIQRPVVYVPLLLLLVAAALAIVVFRPFQNTSPGTATQTPDNTALVPTVESLSVPAVTDSARPELDDELVQAVVDGMSDFVLPVSPVQITQTSLGSTVVVSVCTKAGLGLRTELPRAMLSIAQVASEFAGRFDAIAARMIDCDLNAELRTIGAMGSDANSFVAGTLDQTQFEARWVPIVL